MGPRRLLIGIAAERQNSSREGMKVMSATTVMKVMSDDMTIYPQQKKVMRSATAIHPEQNSSHRILIKSLLLSAAILRTLTQGAYKKPPQSNPLTRSKNPSQKTDQQGGSNEQT
jgi:hypothetical protein